MPEVPPEAVHAALAVRADLLSDRPTPTHLSEELLTRLMLEAAAPVLAEHVAQKITAHMENFGPRKPRGALEPVTDTGRHYRTWRRHFGIAARIAAFAFSTEDDIKRMAAEAIARGDVIVCDIPEAPESPQEKLHRHPEWARLLLEAPDDVLAEAMELIGPDKRERLRRALGITGENE